MDRKPPVRRVLKALGAMTPDEMADTVYDAGIRGFRYSASECPFALYLRERARTGRGGRTVAASWGGVSWRGRVPVWTHRADLPPTVCPFMERFDRGGYPQLDLARQRRAAGR